MTQTKKKTAKHLAAGTDEADATQLVLTSLELCRDYAVRAIIDVTDNGPLNSPQARQTAAVEIIAAVTGSTEASTPVHPNVFYAQIKQLLTITAAEAEKNRMQSLQRGDSIVRQAELREALSTDDDFAYDNPADSGDGMPPHQRAFLTSPTDADIAQMDSRALVTMWHNDLKLLTTALAAIDLLQTFRTVVSADAPRPRRPRSCLKRKISRGASENVGGEPLI